MFDKKNFSEILNKIYKTYSNQRDFADSTGVNRAYLSQYMNKKLENPPTPKILEKIASASNGITNYRELMNICGYITDLNHNNLKYYLKENQLNLIYKAKDDYSLNDDEVFILNDLIRKPYDVKKDSSGNLYLDLHLDDYLTQFKNMDFKRITFLVEIAKQIILNAADNAIEEKNKNQYSYYNCPVYGRISAGQPNWAEECLESYLPIDPNLMNIVNPEECFFLRVNGESMNKLVKNGAYALIRKQDIVENGEIAAVLVNGYDATLKKFTKHGDVVVLEPMSDDPSFQTQIYDKNTEIKILGKYIGKFEINN